eukprot:652143-Pyramimonas_sp.AAC.1
MSLRRLRVWRITTSSAITASAVDSPTFWSTAMLIANPSIRTAVTWATRRGSGGRQEGVRRASGGGQEGVRRAAAIRSIRNE